MKCDICGTPAVATLALMWDDDDSSVTVNVCQSCLEVGPAVAGLLGADRMGVYQPAKEGDDAAGPTPSVA